MAQYVISDIHGCAKTFYALLFNRLRLTHTDQLFLLGDYIDRGPDSKGVLDIIQRLYDNDYQVQCLRGNHEVMLLQSYTTSNEATWVRNGGDETLYSFGVDSVRKIPYPYISMLLKMDYYAKTRTHYLVHAGFNFSNPNFLEDYHAMIWIRQWYDTIPDEWLQSYRIVHGHTPLPRRNIEEQLQYYRKNILPLNIDAGCAYKGHHPELGNLCALNLDTDELVFQENIDINE